MGYRELFLVLLSSVLLSLMMMQINSNAVHGSDALQELELEHTAAAVAQQFIEEAKSKNFDGGIGLIDPSDPNNFTPWNNLGKGAWEIYPLFSDVDDYHNFSRTVYVNGTSFVSDSTVTNGIPFNVGIQVQYVSPANPDSAVSDETYLKRMSVTVTSSDFPGSITVKHVFSYYGVNL